MIEHRAMTSGAPPIRGRRVVDWSSIPLARQRPLSYWTARQGGRSLAPHADGRAHTALRAVPLDGHSMGTAAAQVTAAAMFSDRAQVTESTAHVVRRGGARRQPGAFRRWTPPANAPRRLLSLPETAAYLGVSPWAVRELVWKGELPRVRLSRRLLFDGADIDCLIEARKERP